MKSAQESHTSLVDKPATGPDAGVRAGGRALRPRLDETIEAR